MLMEKGRGGKQRKEKGRVEDGIPHPPISFAPLAT